MAPSLISPPDYTSLVFTVGLLYTLAVAASASHACRAVGHIHVIGVLLERLRVNLCRLGAYSNTSTDASMRVSRHKCMHNKQTSRNANTEDVVSV